MGIKPSGSTPVSVPADNVQNRWGDWEAELSNDGEVAGGVISDTWALADSANTWISENADGLKDRLDLLEGVQGYAHAYMSKNINAAWSLGDNWRTMPFDAQVGPSLGATVQPNGRVRMDSEGLWLIFAKTYGQATSFTGGGAVTMRVRVYRPGGDIHHESFVRGTSLVDSGAIASTYGNISLVETVPVVVDVPGCWVRVDTWTAAWRWWSGGTQLSSLSVLKQSSNVTSPGQSTVPNETEGEANG